MQINFGVTPSLEVFECENKKAVCIKSILHIVIAIDFHMGIVKNILGAVEKIAALFVVLPPQTYTNHI
ncbi:hypothetical protein J6TS2_44800 [Heyndrickxia sporothermodurans]|nr:hypothetical protein J6TS2_44800 [Heyndrickxia sporothermodurans]